MLLISVKLVKDHMILNYVLPKKNLGYRISQHAVMFLVLKTLYLLFRTKTKGIMVGIPFGIPFRFKKKARLADIPPRRYGTTNCKLLHMNYSPTMIQPCSRMENITGQGKITNHGGYLPWEGNLRLG